MLELFLIMQVIRSIIIVTILWVSLLFSATGSINVFTGDNNADIYIDGNFSGKEQVVKQSLEEGLHYIQVKKNNNVVGSKTVQIMPDKTETVVIDNFKDFKTDVGSRGAIEVEAMRLRETRGNVAFGYHGGSPASGLSIRWWPADRFGLQAIGFVNNFQSNVDSRSGFRLLFNFGDMVLKDSALSYYGAIGTGRSMIRNMQDVERNETYDLSEIAFGVEFKIASLYGQQEQSANRHATVISKSVSANSSLLSEAIEILSFQLIMSVGESLMKMSHFYIEGGFERIFTRYYGSDDEQSSDTITAAKISGGVNIYF